MMRNSPWFAAGTIVLGSTFLLALGFVGYWYLGGGAEGFERASELTRIDDQIARYEAAKREGKAPLACILAINISASYFGVGEEDLYQHWRKTRDTDCAGLPGMSPSSARTTGTISP